MAIKKCVPSKIYIKCSEGATPCPLIVINPNITVHGEDMATSADKLFGTSFVGFGYCKQLKGPCVAAVTEWEYTSEDTLTCSNNKILTHESELPCENKGTITIDLDAPSNAIDAPNALDNAVSKTKGAIDKVTAPSREALSGLGDSISEGFSNLGQSAKDFWNADKSTMAGDAFGKTVDGVLGGAKGLSDGIEKTAAIFNLESEARLATDYSKGLWATGFQVFKKLGDGTTAIFNHGKEYYKDASGRYEKDKQLAQEAVDGIFRTYDNAVAWTTDLMTDTSGTLKKTHEDAKMALTDFVVDYNEGDKDHQAEVRANGVLGMITTLAGGGAGKVVSSVANNAIKQAANQVENAVNKISDTAKALKAARQAEKDVITKAKAKAQQKKEAAEKEEAEKKAAEQKAAEEKAAAERTNQKSNNDDQKKGDPVDVVTGTVLYDYIDFEISGIIPIKWERNWYSDSKYMGPLGHGYHHNYDINIEIKENLLLLTLGDGRPAFFPILTIENNSNYNSKEKLTLTLLANQNYELFDHNQQLTYTFKKISKIYKPIRLSNIDGIAIKFQYNNSHLNSIIDTAGRIIKIHSNKKDLITKITAHHKGKDRLLVSYEYNEASDLIKITDAQEKSVLIVYKNHLMVSKTHRLGQTFYWEYERLQPGARCVRTWGDNGLLDYTIAYGKEYNTVTNPLGHQSLFYYENNLATKIVDPLGGEIIKEFDENQNLIKFLDEEGNLTAYDYDERGNIATVKSPDGSTIEYTFDEKGKLQLLTRPEGGMVMRAYKNDRLDSVIEPDGMMTTVEYNDHGLISKVYDNQDHETLLFYDDDYNLTKTQFPNGSISKWEYDCWGQCIKTVNAVKQEQEFSYDSLGNVSKVKLPDNNTIELKYDSYGRIIKAIDNKKTINYQYTIMGNLLSREQDGRKVLFRYDNDEQLMGITNEHSESYNFIRDPKGNIIKEEGFDGLTRKFHHDRAGKVLKVERPDNKYSIYEYDKGNRISRIEHQDGTWSTYSYNKDGLLVKAVNPNSHVKFNRDEAGRILSENQDGYTVTSQYGELGIRTGIKSSLGANINFEHSLIGEVTKMTAKTKQNKPWEANFLYNSLGMETERMLPGGINSSWSYDGSGSPKQHIIKSNAGEQRNRSYAWDVNSKLKKITNHLTNGMVRFSYDDFNSLAAAQYEDGNYDYKLPDEVGNLYRTKDKKDREYGKSGKLLRSGATTYSYDQEGNLIEKDTPKGTWNYTWEAGGMLSHVTKPDRSQIIMEYDALARRTSKTVKPFPKPNASNLKEPTIKRWVWDGNVPLHEWQYNLKDKPKAIVDDSGVIKKDKKEPVEDLITWVFDQGTFRPAAKITAEDTYSIITDYLGTPVEMYNSKGEKTWQAEYDMYGKVRKLAIGSLGDCPFRYQGQYEDVETGLYYNRYRYYSPNEGVYISQDPIGLASGEYNFYSYVNDINVWIDVLGLNKNSNNALGNWVLYKVEDPNLGIAKVGIGKAEDVMADGTNRRAHTSARTVRKDPEFKNARQTVVFNTHKEITKGEMKEIEAKMVRDLRNEGHILPHNKERDKKYQPDYKKSK